MVLVQKEIKAVYLGENKVRPPTPPYLCFTANTAGSTVKLQKYGSPTSVTLETSTDGNTWNTYTFGNTITLSNVGDKVYRRNSSETVTNFSTSTSSYYRFVLTGLVGASGDTNYLLCKTSTTTLPNTHCFCYLFYNANKLTKAPKLPATTLTETCYYSMFSNCTSLRTAPSLPATTLQSNCYSSMFHYCSNLEQLPELPATEIAGYCYMNMFNSCSKIKLSRTQEGEYQNEFRIPKTGTHTGSGSNILESMFTGTGGTWTGTPSFETTYYTSNTVV